MIVKQFKYVLFFICIFFGQQNISAQKTYTFKVRTQKTKCIVTVKDSALWIDKDNTINIKVINPKGKIKVTFLNGTVVKKTDESYVVTFDNGGKTLVSVYQFTKGNFKLIHTELLKVEEPVLYFCGVKVDTKSKGFQMEKEHFRAKSIPFNAPLKIKGYDMVYFDGVSESIFHSDTTMLSKKMTDILFEKPQKKGDQSFRFGEGKRVYFTNIAAVMPDGKNKFLTPFEIFLYQDSTNEDDIEFVFSVNHVYKKK